MTLTTDLSGPCSWDIRTTRTELAAGRISHVEHLDALLERLPTAQRLGAVISADPELAREVSSTTVYRHAGRNLKWAALGFAGGVVLPVHRRFNSSGVAPTPAPTRAGRRRPRR